MTKVEEIQTAIRGLSKEEYAHLRRWFSAADWRRWDEEIKQDSKSGKLDFLKAEAKQARQKGLLGEL